MKTEQNNNSQVNTETVSTLTTFVMMACFIFITSFFFSLPIAICISYCLDCGLAMGFFIAYGFVYSFTYALFAIVICNYMIKSKK